MAIPIEKAFTVDAPVDAVWALLTDPRRVAECLPGAAITEQVDERTWKGQMTVKVGPVSSSYKGTIVFEKLDLAARTAELSGRGQDVRGKGGADLKMRSALAAAPGGGTEVTVVSEVNVTGILAQMGRGMIQDVSDQIFQVFTERMRAALAPAALPAPQPPPEALDVGALGAAATRRAAARLVTRPAFWIAVFVVGFLICWFFLQ